MEVLSFKMLLGIRYHYSVYKSYVCFSNVTLEIVNLPFSFIGKKPHILNGKEKSLLVSDSFSICEVVIMYVLGTSFLYLPDIIFSTSTLS